MSKKKTELRFERKAKLTANNMAAQKRNEERQQKSDRERAYQELPPIKLRPQFE